MSDAQEKTPPAPDPFEPFRAMRDAYLDAMAKTMVETVNTEAYAQATGTMLEGYLSAMAPFREALDKSMLRALQQLELPSRQDVAVLAERFTNVEMRLDDIEAELESIRTSLHQDGSEPESGHGKQAGVVPPAATGQSGVTAANRPGARRPFVRRKVSKRQR
jgi:hypothetical protein